jgi:hypothetical protein
MRMAGAMRAASATWISRVAVERRERRRFGIGVSVVEVRC